MRNRDLISAIVTLILAIALWPQTVNYTNFGGIFPRTVLILMALLSIFIIVKSVLKPQEEAFFQAEHPWNIMVVFVAGIIWVWLLSVLGFAVASVLGMLFLVWFLEKEKRSLRPTLAALVIVVVEVGLFYLFFAKLFLVPLPTGIFL